MIKILLLPANQRSAERSWFDAACVARTQLIMELANEVTDVLGEPGPGLVVVQAAVTTRAQVQEYLLREQPDLVHVLAAPRDPTVPSRSLGPVWELAHDAVGRPADDGFAALFSALQKAVLWVVLDGCANPRQATTIAQFVDCVIGTPAGLPGEQAAGFLRCFYQALGRGLAAPDAFAAAQRWLQLQPVEAALLAVLTTRLLTGESAPPTDDATVRGPAFSVPGPAGEQSPGRVAAKPDNVPPPASIGPPQAARVPDPPPNTTRHLNAGFYLGSTAVPESEPLWLVKSPYRLAVNLGQPWGPGSSEAGIPEQLLSWLFEVVSAVELDVVARSQDLGITPPVQKIRLPKSGDSQKVFFALDLQREGRHSISVDLLYQGHLLQSRRIEFSVATAPGLPAAADPLQEQDGYVTFTRTADLNTQPLKALKDSPRQLTIVAERDPHSATIGLRFYDHRQTELAYQDSRLSEASLTKCLESLRNQLARVMTAYAGPVRATPQLLGRSLGALADLGRRFYRALLPGLIEAPETDADLEEVALLQTALVAGGVIQVAPLSSQLSVPWELLYERPIETYREDRIRLCADFAHHGSAAADCPDQNNPQVVCPHGFWGYRYIIEQLPCRVDRRAAAWNTLPLQIENGAPLHLLAVVNPQLARAASHMAALRTLPGLSLQRVDNLLALQHELSTPQQVAEVVYFYTHGGCDEFGSPYLELAPGSRLLPNDLDAWQVRLPHKPLVVLNACDSANFSPERFDDLIQLLYNCGAAGVLGTQCEVRELLAGEFMMRFLKDFLRQVPAGRALLQARTALLHENDPRGLAYSLFAAADVKLGRPVS